NCIRDCDTHLDRILNELDALKLTDKTIVVFTADHGELGGSHHIIGLDDASIAKACEESAEGQVVSPVNFNSPGQVVIAGHKEAV
ncbi:sulfatase-like hydrolase/transferase, partial [Salmonella enterica subsp. enterica serovar Cerro]|nr:sulfatase-like hydrolase/transferase [Salmonella enterica subsp. enterica serovar Cerro]